MKQSRCLVVDDHPMVCEALESAVRAALPSYAVDLAFTFPQTEEYLRRRSDYALVLLDLMMPGVHGFAGLLLVQQLADCPVIVVSGRNDAHTVALARSFGAAGFIDKAAGLGEVTAAVRRIAAGETVFPAISAEDRPDAATLLAGLSPAQLRVMLALADGRSNKQIAYDLGLSEATVKVHVSAGLKKLGVPNRARAILLLRPAIQL